MFNLHKNKIMNKINFLKIFVMKNLFTIFLKINNVRFQGLNRVMKKPSLNLEVETQNIRIKIKYQIQEEKENVGILKVEKCIIHHILKEKDLKELLKKGNLLKKRKHTRIRT